MKDTKTLMKELYACLAYYVEEDDTYEGGKWEETNAYWLRWKRRAEAALADTAALVVETGDK